MHYMMDLASYASPARLDRIRREARVSLLGNPMNFPTMELRAAWPDADLCADYRRRVRSEVLPTLILIRDLDARTRIENAREIAAGLSRSKVIVVENGAHRFDVFGDPIIQPLLRDFLRDRPGRCNPSVTLSRLSVARWMIGAAGLPHGWPARSFLTSLAPVVGLSGAGAGYWTSMT
jgi:hypothetical protein